MLAGSKHYKYAGGAVAMLRYHVVWTTRRRRAVLTGDVARRLEELLRQTASKMGIDILRLVIEPDHVHLHMVATPDLAPTQIVHRLKSASAALRDEYGDLKKIPSMWTSACYVSSAAQLPPESIQLYVQTQSKSA
jgi:putative transposase